MSAAKKIGELLVQENVIKLDQLEKAKVEQKSNGGRLGAALVKLGYVKETDLAEFVSKQYQIPSIDLSSFEIDPEIVKLIPKEVCEKHLVFPVSKAGDTLVVAMADPGNIFVRDDLRFVTRMKIEVVVAAETAIVKIIEQHYGRKVQMDSIINELEKEDAKNKTQVNSRSGAAMNMGPVVEIVDSGGKDDAPVIKFVNAMLTEAVKTQSSDIHLEPYEKRFRVRFRIDGVLYERLQPPANMASAILSRIKIMSQLDIAERRRPQDGRMKIRTKAGQDIDFRVSVLPTLFGEKIVMRLLDKSNLQLDMTKLGFTERQLQIFKEAIALPHGMVLVTGPTGSGKSTTIYSALMELNKADTNISTAEDPVEFNLEGINQVQMNADVDLTFASALKSFLRQDPDVIMVGEIRDFDTAEIAIKAALTGHLVVSTLHTNDAPSSIYRLLNMGAEPFLVGSVLTCIVAQRLMRQICLHCKEEIKVEPDVLIKAGFDAAEIPNLHIMKGKGCSQCNEIGYRGRVAVYEVLRFTDKLKQGILHGVTPLELKKLAIEDGMTTLRTSALERVRSGVSTIEEAMETTAPDK
ncbi:MAG: type IV-A pilus assembly ATPase PilB [Bdellovibrionales bacterium]